MDFPTGFVVDYPYYLGTANGQVWYNTGSAFQYKRYNPTENLMLPSIRLTLILCLTVPMLYFSTDVFPHSPYGSIWRAFMQNEYEEKWKATEKALNEGLPKTALEIVESIYAMASKEGNQPQLVKAIAYRVALRAATSEDDDTILVKDMEKKIATIGEPARSILKSMLASVYWGYYQQNRWRLYERTRTGDEPEDDYRTWSPERFFDTTRALYLASVEHAELLQGVPAERFSLLLIEHSDSKLYRPTLYDILAHRAIDFLLIDEKNLPKPQRPFEIKDLRALAPVDDFITHNFETPDPGDATYNVILLYQRLLRFHRGKQQGDAVVDLDLRRLSHARDLTFHEHKDTTYYEAVRALYELHIPNSISTLAGHALARYHYEQGDYVKALELCDREIERFSESRGAQDCRVLRVAIVNKELGIQVEETLRPDVPFIISTGFRNIGEMHLRIVRMQDDGEDENYEMFTGRKSPEWLRSLLAKAPLSAWTVTLPGTDDYKPHRVDVKGPPLELGTYVLIASHDESFGFKGNNVVYAHLRVTRLSLQSKEADGRWLFWVNDAVDGRPIPKAKIDMFAYRWESRVRKRQYLGSSKTDRNGHFTLDAGRFNDGVYFRISSGQDTLLLDRTYQSWRRPASKPTRRTMFFTDRAIYRPGQSIHVKGIVTEGEHSKTDYTVLSNMRTTVILYDVNGKKAQEATVTTNEYGSFTATFNAPSGVLTGMMRIANETGSTQIRVEEYKRPTFEVKFDPVEGTYALNESVAIKGKATSYAGANIDGATISYRVVRRVRFPYWYWWWLPVPRGGEQEIAHGVSTTDEDGSFEIAFTATPDWTVKKSDLPIFTFSITADVTDINGETRSASTELSIGYTSVVLGISIPELLDGTQEQSLVLSATNLSGRPVDIEVKMSMERLRTPARIQRNRTLPPPDMFLMSRSEFEQAFPDDVYHNENNPDTWEVERAIMTRDISLGADGTDTTQLSTLAPGRYRITVRGTDPGGMPLELQRFVTVYEPASAQAPYTLTDALIPITTNCEPGETASILFATSYRPAHVLYRLEHRGAVLEERWVNLDGKQRRFDIPILERHRGGLVAQFFFVREYRLYSHAVPITVPWSNKEITVETATFRDKLLPGQEETWTLTIKGPGKDKIAAEVLASMYDASLDAIHQSSWPTFNWPIFTWSNPVAAASFGVRSGISHGEDWNEIVGSISQYYDILNMFILDRFSGLFGRGGFMNGMMVASPQSAYMLVEEADDGREGERMAKRAAVSDSQVDPSEEVGTLESEALDMVKARTDFSETVFFYPTLATDASGNVLLRFTMPEAFTRWKLRVFAHTTDLKTGALEKHTVTQKDLMVIPNMPRFLREGDRITLSTKITNLSDSALSGAVSLQLLDALNMNEISERFELRSGVKSFSVEKDRSTFVTWDVRVPEGISVVTYRVVAKAGNVSDGEEMVLPVLPNRMLVTETLPIWVRGPGTKRFTLDKLQQSSSSPTLRHHALSLEMTSQPAWYAVQALPYLMEFPYECSEQIFNRYYANGIAAHIVNSNPKIKRVFEQWKNTDALLSNLEKNQDLKSLLLEETPWVMQGRDESERKKRVALLFDLNTMANNLESAILKLEKAQAASGGWPWFPGMRESRYITQYIVAGFGHLRELGIDVRDERISRMLRRAVRFMDESMTHDYEMLKQTTGIDPDNDYLGHIEIHYLYARSFFLDQKLDGKHEEASRFWHAQARRWWPRRNYMSQGMIALALHRADDAVVPQAVVKSLRERALHSDEMGMYWKIERGWFWYQAPIETQALLIEVFDEVAGDMDAVEDMKIWLLRQKQVQDWKTTVATAEACYALLRRGSDLLASDKLVEVRLGGNVVDPVAMGAKVEAGTGYYRVDWHTSDITPAMSEVVLKKEDQGVAWGGLYWQYFEQLDRITPHSTPLRIEKKLYRQVNTEKGVTLEPITEQSPLRVGDILKVRITLNVDRDMEYIHMKDMRGAGLDLVNQLSGLRYQQGLRYYEAPRDASVNFFFDWLRKGVHVFEYPLRVTHSGRFSNGISTIQSMYAPEFSSHSAGVVVTVQ